jgi:adenine phosphoribosyltransferase
MSQIDLTQFIRNVPDFPVPGIQFKDITPLLQHPPAFKQVLDIFSERYRERNLDAIVAIESRGFIFGAALAYILDVGMVPVRKAGKLPADTYVVEYELEYGTNKIEIHRDALQPGARVLIIDDLLATGGTTAATCELVEKLGAVIDEIAFVIELDFLHGRDKLQKYTVHTLIHF